MVVVDHPRPRGLPTPTDRLSLHVSGTEPILAAEEVLPHVGDLSLDVRLSRGVVRDSRVDHEPAMGGVLRKRSLERGFVAVSLDDRGAKVIQDQSDGDPIEELPGRLQTGDHIRQRLARSDVDVHVPAVDQNDHERIEQAPTLDLRIEDIAEPTEVDLAHLARTRGGQRTVTWPRPKAQCLTAKRCSEL